MEMFDELKAIKAQVEAAGIDTEAVEADINGWYFIDTSYIPEYVCEKLNLAGFYCAPVTDIQYDGTWRYRISRIQPPPPASTEAREPAGSSAMAYGDEYTSWQAAGEAGRSMLVFHDIGEANLAIDTANEEIATLQADLASARQRLLDAEGERDRLVQAVVRYNAVDPLANPTANTAEYSALWELADEINMRSVFATADAADGGER